MTTQSKSEVRYPISPPPSNPIHTVRLDWKAYFEQFCEAHKYKGGGPVVDGGRLLFADGWSYSADDYAGPEWPPPRELHTLIEVQIRYWIRRRQIVTGERNKLANMMEGLDELRKERPLPLLQSITSYDEEVGRWQRSSSEIDWYALSERLKWLNEDVRVCNEELRLLGEYS